MMSLWNCANRLKPLQMFASLLEYCCISYWSFASHAVSTCFTKMCMVLVAFLSLQCARQTDASVPSILTYQTQLGVTQTGLGVTDGHCAGRHLPQSHLRNVKIPFPPPPPPCCDDLLRWRLVGFGWLAINSRWVFRGVSL